MAASVRPLLCRSPLHPNESLPSFLIRLAAVNRYEYAPTQVMALCRQHLSVSDDVARPAKSETYRVLSELVGIDAQKLHAATVHHFAPLFMVPPYEAPTIRLAADQNVPVLGNCILRDHVWPDTQAQFCPFCLKESGYHQLTWTPFVVTICLKHCCLLVQSCPGCQQPLNIRAILQAKCFKCGFVLTEASTHRVATNKFALFSQAMIQSWLGLCSVSAQTDQGLPDQPPAILYHLLQGLHWVVVNVVQHWRLLNRSRFSPIQRYRHYVTAFRGMVNWPQGFYDFLERYKQGWGHRSSPPAYPYWFDMLWQSPAFQFVQDAVDQYLLEHHSPLFLLRLQRTQASFTFRLKLPCLSETDAANVLNTTPMVIRRLIGAGYLAHYPAVEDEALARRLNLVSHVEVLRLQRQWSQAIPVADVANLLGTTDEVIRDLAKVGLLDTGLSNLGQDNHCPEGVSWRALTTLTNRLQRTVRSHPATTALSLCSLEQVTHWIAPYGGNSAMIIQRILSKELHSYWPQQGYRLDCLEIPRPDVDNLLEGQLTKAPRLTLNQVANMMGVTGTTILAWIKLDLLTIVAQRNRVIYLDRAEVLSFINTHIFFDDVTAVLGLRKCVVRRWLENGEVLPVSDPEVVGHSRYLFNRADLERIKEKNRLG
jgi:hypothetical protein